MLLLINYILLYSYQQTYTIKFFLSSIVPAVYSSVNCLRSDYLYLSKYYPLPLHTSSLLHPYKFSCSLTNPFDNLIILHSFDFLQLIQHISFPYRFTSFLSIFDKFIDYDFFLLRHSMN